MNYDSIVNLLSSDALELYGQPKWTFGKNTCNTYEIFPEKVHLPTGEIMPSWAVLDVIAKDAQLTLMFSRWFLDKSMAVISALSNKRTQTSPCRSTSCPCTLHRTALWTTCSPCWKSTASTRISCSLSSAKRRI